MSAASRQALGTPRVHFRRLGSTNARARELAAAGAPHGTLVTASEQTAGRGRHGREWWAPAGDSLLMSLVLHDVPELLPLMAALAVCDAVGDAAQIKWPNDVVLVGGEGPRISKLAGILIEGCPYEEQVVLGIGVNVAVSPDAVPAELRSAVATLGRSRAAIEPLLGRLLRALEGRLAEPPEATRAAWRARDVLRDRLIAWRTAGAQEQFAAVGRGEGIDDAGRLLVACSDGTRIALEAGEVHLVEPESGNEG